MRALRKSTLAEWWRRLAGFRRSPSGAVREADSPKSRMHERVATTVDSDPRCADVLRSFHETSVTPARE